MASKKASEVTADNVDDLTDEQIAELMAGQEAETEENTGEEATEQAQDAEKQDEATETAKAEEKASDEAENDDDTEDDNQQKAEHVPFKRYDHERNRRKAAEEQAKKDREEWQRRFDELLKAGVGKKEAEQKQEAEPEIPDPDTDPQGAIRWAREQILAREQRDREAAERQTQEQQQQEASNRLLQEAGEEFAAAEQGDPEVRQAYDALVQSYQQEAKAYRLPQAEAQRYMQQTEFQHIAYARQNNIPLADYIKGLATARGWRPQPVQQDTQEQQQQAEANRAEAQRKAKTLSNGGGSPGVSNGLTPEQILDLSDAEFNALIEKYGDLASALAAQ